MQEPLDTSGRVVGTLTLVTVWEQQHHVGGLTPLGLTRRDELVDDRLGAVHEVTELGFPQHEGIGMTHRVTVFEADHRVFAQCGVVGEEPAGVVRVGLGDRTQRCVLLAGLPVDQDRVTLGESASARVLAGQPHRAALFDQ